MEIYKKFFGDKLKKAISTAGISQSRLAEILKVEPPTISRWANGHDFPQDTRLGDICSALGVETRYFTEGDPPESILKENKRLKEILSLIPHEWFARLAVKNPVDWNAAAARALLSDDLSHLKDLELPDEIKLFFEKGLRKSE